MTASDKRTVSVVTACMRTNGAPTFARSDVAVTQEEIENGIHYYLVEGDLLSAGYEESMMHFASDEAPAFLFPAVAQLVRDEAARPEPSLDVLSEKP
jgi:hypothetical protein